MISVENLTKSFGRQVILDGISFKVNSKERIGLVGRNGHGKTTLFNLIIGREQPDAGSVIIPKNYRIGHVRQHIEFTRQTVREEGAVGLPEHERDQYWKVDKILSGLGFSARDLDRHPAEFSGGFQVRLNLAKVLVSEPDLLLLDEPTNYLDIASIRWIERFLLGWPHEVMLITHNRSFMDHLVTHVVGIHRKKSRKIKGDTEKYYAQIAQEEEICEKTRVNDERRRREIELFITRFRAKARLANMVQSRIRTLAKMEPREKLEAVKTLEFSFRSRPFNAKQVMTVEKIGFSYSPGAPLFDRLSFFVNRGDRVCIIGRNGKGKTTLLKLLAGVLAPRQGAVKTHAAIKSGFFEQTNVKSLVAARTVEEELLYSNPDIDRQAVRNICGAMMFSGNDALKKIGVLSGGEKSRVMLGKLLVTPVNLLLLDEPTNHLDMESSDSLLAALDSFDGTVIMVTHNEMFLHALAQRLIVFEEDRVSLFEGTYQQFLDHRGWQDEALSGKLKASGTGVSRPMPRLTKKQIRQMRSEFVSRRSKTLKPTETRIHRVENEIEAREKKLADLHADILAASQAQDGHAIATLSRSIHRCQTAIDEFFDELEELSNRLDQQKKTFEAELERLERQFVE